MSQDDAQVSAEEPAPDASGEAGAGDAMDVEEDGAAGDEQEQTKPLSHEKKYCPALAWPSHTRSLSRGWLKFWIPARWLCFPFPLLR